MYSVTQLLNAVVKKDACYSQVVPVLSHDNEQIEQEARAVFVHERPSMIEAKEEHVQ